MFCFKQKTAYEMRISDWSSDVCSSDLRLNTVFHLPNAPGRSRQGLPVRTIHNIASIKRRLSPPLRPGSLRLPRQCGSIFAHWASVKTSLSIRSLNQKMSPLGIMNLNRPKTGPHQIGRASCREKGYQYVTIKVVAGSLKKKKIK